LPITKEQTNNVEETTIRKSRKGRARNLILHLHPPKVQRASIDFTLTFGLGGMSAVLFILQVFTGILLRFRYSPTPNDAYDSILSLQGDILFGQLVRNIHHWSGILFVIITFLHLLRTFYTGAFYWERRWNWVIGVVLMVLVIFSNFTGYLLPWDQLAYWAVTVSTSMLSYVPLAGDQLVTFVRGGASVGAPTLLIFYNFHTAVLPIALVILMSFHFWRVRKNKGVVVSKEKPSEMVPADPDLVSKELVTALVLIAVILLLSVFFDAPLQERANPSFSPNPAKAPWYFMGIQELLMHFHPLFGAVIIPTLFLIGMFWLPFTGFRLKHEGKWFMTQKGKQLAVVATMIALTGTVGGILLGEYVIDTQLWIPSLDQVISNGLMPFGILLILLALIVWLIKRKYKPDKSELILFIFTFLMVSYVVLSIVGIWFRGPGMKLVLQF
jgi:quinol-cytochrome oxidoreductase complex cytochrome b subunit